MIKYLIVVTFITFKVFALENNQTEITTDDGIEVFQNEKYYLLKGNVIINSNDFLLKANLVKAYFNKDLYDIIKIECNEKVSFISKKGVEAKGNELNFDIIKNTIEIIGLNSSLKNSDFSLKSNGLIFINNINGKFYLKGQSSNLKTNDLLVTGENIKGSYFIHEGNNEIINLEVTDKNTTNILTDKINMFSIKAIYSKKKNLIELIDKVKIIKDNEIITGDYAKINTLDNSYKISSEGDNKVKIILNNTNE